MAARILLCLIWVAAIVTVIAGSLSPALAPPSGLMIDKLIHGSSYFALTCLGLTVVRSPNWRWAVLAFLFVLGAGIEVSQAIIGGREASVWDQLANTTGIALAAIAGRLLANRLTIVHA